MPRVVSALLTMALPATTCIVGILTILAQAPTTALSTRAVVGSVAVATLMPIVVFGLLHWFVPAFDRILVASAGMLTAVGLVEIAGLAAGSGPDHDFYVEVLTRHGLFIGGGFTALLAGTIIAHHLDVVARYPYTILGAALTLTTATAALGETVNGARLWLQLGPMRFQPSELVKILLAAFVSIYLYDRRHLVAAPWRVGSLDLPPAPYLVPLAGAVLGAVGVLAFQNDLGMAALLVLGAFATVAGVVRSRGAIIAAFLGLAGAFVASYLAVPRVRDRVAGWLDPWADPLGRGFQFVQADYSVTAGGLLGSGTGASAASVPEVHTDFVLVGIASQLGLAVALGVLAMSGVLVVRCFANALSARSQLAGLVALSLTALLAIQVLLIAGGTLRVLPLTGLTFPLVSYGGTSIMTTLFALGLIVGIGAADGRS